MSRITERDERGNAQIVEYYNTKEATDKLAAYEDMGIPTVDTSVLTHALIAYGGDTQVDMMIEEMEMDCIMRRRGVRAATQSVMSAKTKAEGQS